MAEQCYKIILSDNESSVRDIKVVALLLGYGVSYDALSPFEEREKCFYVISNPGDETLQRFCEVSVEVCDTNKDSKFQFYRDLSRLEAMAVKAIGKQYWENKKC